MIPADQASDCRTRLVARPPIRSARTALTVIVIGWCSAKGCSQSGIVAVGTNALDANTSGKTSGKLAACALSALGTDSPTSAKNHEKEKENASSIPIARNSDATL